MNDKNQNEVLLTENLDENNLDAEMESLKHKINELIEEKNIMESDFGERRGKFKEIILKKEEEMRMNKEETAKKIKELRDQLNHLQKELDESKSLLTVSKIQKQNEIDYFRQKHNQEIGLMRLNLNEKLETIKLQHDQEVEQLKKVINGNELVNSSNLNNKSTTSNSKSESMLSVVTKSFKQKVGSFNTTLNTSGLLNSSFDDKLQQTTSSTGFRSAFKEQEEEFDFILPLEEETKMLKEKLRNTDKKLNSYEKILKILISEFGIEKICELINACSNPEETFDTVNKFKEEFISKKKLNASIQLDDKDSILANLLCEQAKLRSENEKLLKKIDQLVNYNQSSQNKTKQNQLIVPNLINKLKRSQSLTIFNKLGDQNNLDSKINQRQIKFNLKPIIKDSSNFKLNKACEMCSNYELQLQSLQISESDFLKKIENYDRLLDASKQELIKEQEFRLQMEEKYIQQAKECENTIEALKTKLATANYEISQLKCSFNDTRKRLTEKLEEFKKLNSKLNHNLVNLQNENAQLLGRFVEKSKQLQREAIDLPQTLEDVQFYCLKIREDLISVSIAKEKLEEDFKSQMMLIKEQQKSDYLSEKRIEESLTTENEKLRTQLSSALKELNNLKAVHDNHELLIKQTTFSIQNYEKRINELQYSTADLMAIKIKFEQENNDLKCKIQNLQAELETSEAVQKDFVKLSQSLQIDIEKIRQADSEVRWQHEDDVLDCNNCKKKFSSKKEKIHCSHCGKIFCQECSNKTIMGGPFKNRRFKVCYVCHTLLDQTSAPYFSSLSVN